MKIVAKDAADRWDQIAAKVGCSKIVCLSKAKDLANKIKEEKDAKANEAAAAVAAAVALAASTQKPVSAEWTKEEKSSLVKAVKQYPANFLGDRFKLIGEFLKKVLAVL